LQNSLHQKEFTRLLLQWHKKDNKRKMPWKGEKDPYKIWLSEIILQQTRVEQGLPYYNNFIDKYPSVTDLAKANDEDVFKLWEGLGYYSRCRNLLQTARIIVQEHGGSFPTNYESILALKGIGPYTAAAISSFAYGLPKAVVDGNVYRVLARYFGIEDAIDSTKGKKLFSALAEDLLYSKDAAAYNQAIMDFGATMCTPKSPICNNCPLSKHCIAYKTEKVELLPIKEKKLVKKNRYFIYLIIAHKGKWLIRERSAKDIWQNLNEFLLVEMDQMPDLTPKTVKTILTDLNIPATTSIHFISPVQVQQLTHQTLYGRFVHLELTAIPAAYKQEMWVAKDQIAALAFPRFITRYLQDHQQQQTLF